ncbi:hypothetical protein [Candidatus Marithrix sp. Canyon 246]|uniref:hypothetical protein n=1 Tax=Candidatus Marithrix sp. Canyon 246 TaxID=1827136 RepID=UPI00084A151F|nr:hypothetical protein [Candidatus Marithrix sp. Canyon 246]
MTATLPQKGESVDLSADPVLGGEGILPAINRLQESGQTVRFKTDTQIEVLALPAVQDISSFKQSLSKINLPKVNISNDGNIKVPATETIKVTEIADSNDVMITYPDGTEQRLFALSK